MPPASLYYMRTNSPVQTAVNDNQEVTMLATTVFDKRRNPEFQIVHSISPIIRFRTSHVALQQHASMRF